MKRLKALLAVLSLSVIMGISVGCSGDDGGENSQAETESESPSSQENISTEEEFGMMYSNPDDYKGAKVDFVAKVFLEPERDEDGVYFQCYAYGNDSFNTMVAVSGESDVEDGDYVHIKGEVKGSYEGENMLGGNVKAATVLADSVEITDYATAIAPAIETKEVNKEINQHGYVMKLEKVEFAEEETRAYMTIDNQSNNNITFYDFNAKAIQGNTQLEPEDNWEAEYDEINSDILPGVSENGVVVFERANPDEPITLHFEGRSDDYSTDFENFTFEIQ